MNFIVGKVENGTFISKDDYYHIDLSKLSAEQLNKINGKAITLGYRPETAVIGEEDLKGDKSEYLEMKGKVEVYEMLGDLQNVYLNVGEEKSIIKAKPEIQIVIGSEMTYFVKKSDFHFFDTNSGDAIEL
jgi:ABC-type sugar transport system ATPase subunit